MISRSKNLSLLVSAVLMISLMGADKMESNSENILFSFQKPEEAKQWQTINDTVMGGVSRSQFQINENGGAQFLGVVSLENNGGFASVRSKVGKYDLHQHKGILIKVRGDGKRYKFSIKTDSNFDGVMYQQNFHPKKNKWQTLFLPFEKFAPTFRGRILPNEPALDGRSIRTFGLMISEKQPGPFKLEIEWIKAGCAPKQNAQDSSD